MEGGCPYCDFVKLVIRCLFSGFIPPDMFMMAQDAHVYFMQTHSDPSNFGHMLIDDLFSAYAAMDAFDVMTNKSRMLMMFWSACAGGGPDFEYLPNEHPSMNGRDISDWWVF